MHQNRDQYLHFRSTTTTSSALTSALSLTVECGGTTSISVSARRGGRVGGIGGNDGVGSSALSCD
jgi:hypothetical protein